MKVGHDTLFPTQYNGLFEHVDDFFGRQRCLIVAVHQGSLGGVPLNVLEAIRLREDIEANGLLPLTLVGVQCLNPLDQL